MSPCPPAPLPQAALVSSYRDLASDGASLQDIAQLVATGAALLLLSGAHMAAAAAAEQVGRGCPWLLFRSQCADGRCSQPAGDGGPRGQAGLSARPCPDELPATPPPLPPCHDLLGWPPLLHSCPCFLPTHHTRPQVSAVADSLPSAEEVREGVVAGVQAAGGWLQQAAADSWQGLLEGGLGLGGGEGAEAGGDDGGGGGGGKNGIATAAELAAAGAAVAIGGQSGRSGGGLGWGRKGGDNGAESDEEEDGEEGGGSGGGRAAPRVRWGWGRGAKTQDGEGGDEAV